MISVDAKMNFNEKTLGGEIILLVKDEENDIEHTFNYKFNNQKDLEIIWGKTIQESCFYKDICENFPMLEKKEIYKIVKKLPLLLVSLAKKLWGESIISDKTRF